MNASLKRTLAIARKEFFHIIHDPRSLFIIFLLPTFQLIMFGYALNLEIKRVDLAVINLDGGSVSRQLVDRFRASPFFRVIPYDGPVARLETLFLKRQARAALIISQDFSRMLQTQPRVPVQLIIDAVDPNAATLIRTYCNQIVAEFNRQTGLHLPLPFEVTSTIWFNPDLKSAYFFVPGLLALILVMLCALLTSITITREKETGTLEQMLVSPVQPREIIAGKVLPYVLIAAVIGLLILTIGRVLFDVPFRGSFTLLTFFSTIYILTALSMGLMISTVARTQQVATMMAQVATLLPTIILSGFIFPVASMPRVLQWISYIVPAKYYLKIVRGIMLKGNTFEQLMQPAAVLLFMALLLFLNARRKFSMTLEG